MQAKWSCFCFQLWSCPSPLICFIECHFRRQLESKNCFTYLMIWYLFHCGFHHPGQVIVQTCLGGLLCLARGTHTHQFDSEQRCQLHFVAFGLQIATRILASQAAIQYQALDTSTRVHLSC